MNPDIWFVNLMARVIVIALAAAWIRLAGYHETQRITSVNRSLLPLFFNLCRVWSLKESDQAQLLGIESDVLSALKGSENQPLTPELEKRVAELLEIYGQLHALYPNDPDLADTWIIDRNAHYDGRTPLAFMQQQGMRGIVAVRKYLSSI